MRCFRTKGPVVLFLFSLVVLGTACMDQYNPRPYWQQFRQERAIASKPLAKLTATGEIPEVGAVTVSIDEKYQQLCASCHGAQGAGDGPAGAALTPKPRSFVDAAWQASVDDARIEAVLVGGGAAVGLSATMPPWSGVLTPEEIQQMVGIVRAFSPQ